MRSILATALVLLFSSVARGDEVLLKSGGAVRGKVLSEDEKEVVIQTDAGKVKIPREKVEKVVKSSGKGGGAAPTEGPAGTDDGPPRTDRRVLLLAFEGVEAAQLDELAQRLQRATGLGVEVLRSARPKPNDAAVVDRRKDFVQDLAQRLGVPLEGSVDDVERAVRAKIATGPDPKKNEQVLALLDEVKAQQRLSAPALVGQTVKAAGERLDREGALAAVAVVDRDMCTPETNFLFGHSDGEKRAGVVAIRRFKTGEPSRDLLIKRTVVQLVSTTSALMGIASCKETACARRSPQTLEEHDTKPETLCRSCKAKLEAAIKAAR